MESRPVDYCTLIVFHLSPTLAFIWSQLLGQLTQNSSGFSIFPLSIPSYRTVCLAPVWHHNLLSISSRYQLGNGKGIYQAVDLLAPLFGCGFNGSRLLWHDISHISPKSFQIFFMLCKIYFKWTYVSLIMVQPSSSFRLPCSFGLQSTRICRKLKNSLRIFWQAY